MTEPGTVTAQLEELECRGFGANFGVVGNAVQVLTSFDSRAGITSDGGRTQLGWPRYFGRVTFTACR
jgi:hypothetical protein